MRRRLRKLIPPNGWDTGLWWAVYTPVLLEPHDGDVFLVLHTDQIQGPQVDIGTRRRAVTVGWYHRDWRRRLALARHS